MKNKKLQDYLSRMESLKHRDLDNHSVLHIHHIIPKFMGGDDLEHNKVTLTIEEHIQAHIELANCFPIGSEKRNKNLCSANVTKVWANRPIIVDISGKNNPMWGKKHSTFTKNIIGKKSAMKHFSEKYRKKLSDATSGQNNPMWGKKHSKKTKRKISNAVKGEKHPWYGTTRPDDVKDKIGMSQPTRKAVGKYDTNGNLIEVYDSLGKAAKANNIRQGNLSTYFKKNGINKNGKPKILGGYVWREII